ncbi:TonB-dependent receptor plug domain-containing protein [Rubrivirga sp.]|uniref:TonB-dependent receptor plug domain-containing protein n=1 Tax=Rubrivirga sp. TaxID=1885344 RepID=UPI003C709201
MLRPLLLLVVVVAPVLAGCGAGNGARHVSDPNVLEGDEIERRSLARIEDMLRGQIAGVQVREEGGSLVIRIRGNETFSNTSNSDPLFIIDGLAIPLGTSGALDGLNPNDVESIRVLKNASDTAMYGSRGANGVVVITTYD